MNDEYWEDMSDEAQDRRDAYHAYDAELFNYQAEEAAARIRAAREGNRYVARSTIL